MRGSSVDRLLAGADCQFGKKHPTTSGPVGSTHYAGNRFATRGSCQQHQPRRNRRCSAFVPRTFSPPFHAANRHSFPTLHSLVTPRYCCFLLRCRSQSDRGFICRRLCRCRPLFPHLQTHVWRSTNQYPARIAVSFKLVLRLTPTLTSPFNPKRKVIMNTSSESTCQCTVCTGAACQCGCQQIAQQKVCCCGSPCRCGENCTCVKG